MNPDAPCAGKARYRTGGQARAALDVIRRRGTRAADGVKPARAYPCPAPPDGCGGWHLTSSPVVDRRTRGLG